jgi:hypothetical protein
MNGSDLEKALIAITKHAPALRAAGVTGLVKIEFVEFNLTESTPSPLTITGKDDAAESDRHALDDPHTYGGSIPVRRVPGRELRDDDAGERD